MISASFDCRSKNVGVLSIVIPKLKLSDVKMQIFPANLMVRPNNTTLEDRPESFNRIRVDRANDMLTDGVVDGLMGETMFQSDIARIGISTEKAYAVRYRFADEGFKRISIGILDNASNYVAFPLDCAHYRSFASVAAPTLPAFLVPMSVLIAPAAVAFINLNDTAELLDVLDHCGFDFVAHEPSGFVRAEAHIAEDLEGAHALLADQHEMRDSIPILQRLIRVLEDCPGQVRESIAFIRAGVALPTKFHCRDRIDLCRAASRAMNALWPAPSYKVADAIFFGFKKFIELRRCQLMNWFGAGHFGNLTDRKDALA